MKQISVTLEVEDDFEPGCCHECPFKYEESGCDEYGDYDYWDCCVFGCNYKECPLVIEQEQ